MRGLDLEGQTHAGIPGLDVLSGGLEVNASSHFLQRHRNNTQHAGDARYVRGPVSRAHSILPATLLGGGYYSPSVTGGTGTQRGEVGGRAASKPRCAHRQSPGPAP